MERFPIRSFCGGLFLLSGLICGSDTCLGLDEDTSYIPIHISIEPAPNKHWWNNTEVVVRFSVTNHSSPIRFLSSPVVLSQDTNNAEVAGVAIDSTGVTSTNLALINVDRTPPEITLSVGNEGTFDDSYPVLVVGFEDRPPTAHVEPSGLDPDSFQSTLDGQVITNLFYRISNGAFAVLQHLPAGLHTWVVRISDLAGNTTVVSNTFNATGTINTNAPLITNLSLTDEVTRTPSLHAVWLQGKVTGRNSTVHVLEDPTKPTRPMNRRGEYFGAYLGDWGLDRDDLKAVLLVATDASGRNRTAHLIKVQVTEAYRAHLEEPRFDCGHFSNGKPQPVSGFTSAVFDDPSGPLTLTSVRVNGRLATFSGVISNGLAHWGGVVLPPPGYDEAPVPIILSMCWSGATSNGAQTNICANVPFTYMDGHEVVRRVAVSTEYTLGGQYPSQTVPGNSCGPDRWVRSDAVSKTVTEFGPPCAGGPNVLTTSFQIDGVEGCAEEEPSFEDVAHDLQPIEEHRSHLAAADRGMAFGVAESTTLHTRYETGDNVLFLQGQLLTEEGTIVYRQPFHARDEVHIVTFEGVSGVNLENLVFEGDRPVHFNEDEGTVSYLKTLHGQKEWVITADSFRWEVQSTDTFTEHPRDDPDAQGKHREWRTETHQLLRFTNFRQ